METIIAALLQHVPERWQATVLQIAGICFACFVVLPTWQTLKACAQAWEAWAQLPGPPPSSWLSGHVDDFTSPKLHEALSKWCNTYGPLYRLRIAHIRMAVLTDPAAAALILRRAPPAAGAAAGAAPAAPAAAVYCPKATQLYRPLDAPVLGQPSVLTYEDGPLQAAVRAATAPCFSSANMKLVFPRVAALAQRFADALATTAPPGATDAAALARAFTVDAVGWLLFGEDVGSMRGASGTRDYVDTIERAEAGVHRLLADPLFALKVWKPQWWEDRRAFRRNNAYAEGRARALRARPPPPQTVFAALTRVVRPDGRPLTFAQLTANLSMFMAAGFDTTANSIAFTLGLLAAYPDTQDRLEAELDEAGLLATAERPRPRAFEHTDLGRLPYLGAVVREALRFASPATTGTIRRVAAREGVRLCGRLVPQGTIVMVPFGAVGRSVANFGAAADEFRPERWLAAGGGEGDGGGGGGGGAAPGALPSDNTPFSIGPRDCIGQAFARLELQTVLAVSVGRFRVRLAPEVGGRQGLVDRMVYHIMLQPKDGLPIVAVPRV